MLPRIWVSTGSQQSPVWLAPLALPWFEIRYRLPGTVMAHEPLAGQASQWVLLSDPRLLK